MNTERGFFNRVAIGEDFNWIGAVKEPEAERRSIVILETLNPVVAFSHLLKFEKAPSTWVGKKCGYRVGLSYHADMPKHVVEVLDVPPNKCGWTPENGDIFSVPRLVGIYKESSKPGQKRGVFIRLSPNFSPSVYISNNKCVAYANFVNIGKSAPAVAAAVGKLVDTIEEKVPAPKWAVDFDKNYEIRKSSIGRKPKPSCDCV